MSHKFLWGIHLNIIFILTQWPLSLSSLSRSPPVIFLPHNFYYFYSIKKREHNKRKVENRYKLTVISIYHKLTLLWVYKNLFNLLIKRRLKREHNYRHRRKFHGKVSVQDKRKTLSHPIKGYNFADRPLRKTEVRRSNDGEWGGIPEFLKRRK